MNLPSASVVALAHGSPPQSCCLPRAIPFAPVCHASTTAPASGLQSGPRTRPETTSFSPRPLPPAKSSAIAGALRGVLLHCPAKIVDGIATVDSINLEGSKVRLGIAGSASIPARDFDLHGVAALASASADAAPAFELPFVVQGPWDDPILLPDTQSLLARSPVAGPLMNAVRNRNTRDTVRSAIERLTGGAVSPPAGAPAPKP